MSFIFSPWRKKEDKHRVAQPQPLVQEEYGVSTRGPGTADVVGVNLFFNVLESRSVLGICE